MGKNIYKLKEDIEKEKERQSQIISEENLKAFKTGSRNYYQSQGMSGGPED